ncbi:MAG TPA: hypothetical protein DET46_13890 [Comamonadaceae bacterium]|nr:hypothetical protein [Comamonadaceae bacterium]
MKHPPESLRAFPPLSHRCAMRAGGRPQRTPEKRRLRGMAALARGPLAWATPVSRIAGNATSQDELQQRFSFPSGPAPAV